MEEKGANIAAADLSTTSTMIDTSGGGGGSVTETPKRTPMLKLGRTKLGA